MTKASKTLQGLQDELQSKETFVQMVKPLGSSQWTTVAFIPEHLLSSLTTELTKLNNN